MKDAYGNEYELISGKTYKSTAYEYDYVEHGNIAVLMPGYKDNNGLYVIYFGKLDETAAEKAIIAMGWRVEDWL